MNPPRRLAAVRHGLSVLVASQVLGAAVAWADGQAQLLLPIVSAMALGVSAVEATTDEPHGAPSLLASPPARADAQLVPSRLRIPDAYAIDLERAPRRFVEPVDSDRVVAFDVLQRPRRGLNLSLAYDEEVRGPFPGTAAVVRFVAEFRF